VSGKGYHLAVILLLAAVTVVWWGVLAWVIWYLILDANEDSIPLIRRTPFPQRITPLSPQFPVRRPVFDHIKLLASFPEAPRAKRCSLEPTFIASVDGLCGFILVVGDEEVDAFTPSGEWLGVFHDRVEAAEAVIQYADA
jgi:hypothetical protein